MAQEFSRDPDVLVEGDFPPWGEDYLDRRRSRPMQEKAPPGIPAHPKEKGQRQESQEHPAGAPRGLPGGNPGQGQPPLLSQIAALEGGEIFLLEGGQRLPPGLLLLQLQGCLQPVGILRKVPLVLPA